MRTLHVAVPGAKHDSHEYYEHRRGLTSDIERVDERAVKVVPQEHGHEDPMHNVARERRRAMEDPKVSGDEERWTFLDDPT